MVPGGDPIPVSARISEVVVINIGGANVYGDVPAGLTVPCPGGGPVVPPEGMVGTTSGGGYGEVVLNLTPVTQQVPVSHLHSIASACVVFVAPVPPAGESVTMVTDGGVVVPLVWLLASSVVYSLRQSYSGAPSSSKWTSAEFSGAIVIALSLSVPSTAFAFGSLVNLRHIGMLWTT